MKSNFNILYRQYTFQSKTVDKLDHFPSLILALVSKYYWTVDHTCVSSVSVLQNFEETEIFIKKSLCYLVFQSKICLTDEKAKVFISKLLTFYILNLLLRYKAIYLSKVEYFSSLSIKVNKVRIFIADSWILDVYKGLKYQWFRMFQVSKNYHAKNITFLIHPYES